MLNKTLTQFNTVTDVFFKQKRQSTKTFVSKLYSVIRKDKYSRTIGNPNTCAEVKLCLFLFMPALKVVCRKTEALNTANSAQIQLDSQ